MIGDKNDLFTFIPTNMYNEEISYYSTGTRCNKKMYNYSIVNQYIHAPRKDFNLLQQTTNGT